MRYPKPKKIETITKHETWNLIFLDSFYSLTVSINHFENVMLFLIVNEKFIYVNTNFYILYVKKIIQLLYINEKLHLLLHKPTVYLLYGYFKKDVIRFISIILTEISR